MKKIILFASLVFFSLGAFAGPDSKSKPENPVVPNQKENKMSEEEINKLPKPAEELNDANKTNQTIVVQEGHRGRGHRGMDNREHRRNGGVIFIGGGGVLLIILLVILLA